MKFTKYQQGNSITLEGLKYHLRIADNTHDAELAVLLKSATIYIQAYLNTTLVECSVMQEQPVAGTDFTIYFTDQTNIQVKDYGNNAMDFTREGNHLSLAEPKAVRISYDCTPAADVEQYAQLVYQIAGANYDGQPDMIAKILKNYPVI
jgi:hypothetical protein